MIINFGDIDTDNKDDIRKAIKMLQMHLNEDEVFSDAQNKSDPAVNKLYTCKWAGGTAYIEETVQGKYIIKKDSRISSVTKESCYKTAADLKQEFFDDGTFQKVNEVYAVVTRDSKKINSKSLAASIVVGSNANGNIRLAEVK